MTDNINSLPDDPVLLKKLLVKQAVRLVFLEEQFCLAQQQRFGASSEGHPAQGDLFNEAEVEFDIIEDTVESIPKTVNKKSVLAVLRHYIKWVNRTVKSLNLFKPKLK